MESHSDRPGVKMDWWREMTTRIGKTFSGISPKTLNWILAAFAISVMIVPCGGNPNAGYLPEKDLIAILDTQGQSSERCFQQVFKLQSAVERSYSTRGKFRESVIEYHHKINLPIPDSSWPDKVREPMITCGMEYALPLASQGLGDRDTKVTRFYVLLARDRENPNNWWVLKATEI